MRTQYIPRFGGISQECGDFTWRLSDCEELVGVTWRLSDSEELVGSIKLLKITPPQLSKTIK